MEREKEVLLNKFGLQTNWLVWRFCSIWDWLFGIQVFAQKWIVCHFPCKVAPCKLRHSWWSRPEFTRHYSFFKKSNVAKYKKINIITFNPTPFCFPIEKVEKFNIQQQFNLDIVMISGKFIFAKNSWMFKQLKIFYMHKRYCPEMHLTVNPFNLLFLY